jgi:biopolymer transport protein ExbD
MPRKLPEYNASSLADIAFMLLIFFLVTTTMDVDSGLRRKLPAQVPPEQDTPPPIKERNVFVVLVDAKNRLLVNGELMRVNDLRDKAKEFLANPNNSETLPEKKIEEIEFFGTTEISKGIISLRNDVGTTYGTYISVQNELVGAIAELRDELSKRKWNKPFNELESAKSKAVKKAIPSLISEAEPKRVGGKK